MKVTNHILYAGALAFAMLFVSGCSKQEAAKDPDTPPTPEAKQEIRFKFFVEEGDKLIPYEDYWNAVNPSIPGPVTRAADNDLSKLKLYGWYNTADCPDGSAEVTSTEAAPAEKRFFNLIDIKADGTYAGERRYWGADGATRHSFAAIAGLSGTDYLSSGFTTASFIPTAKQIIAPDPKNQTDLLMAYGPVNIVIDGTVPVVNICLKHILTKVVFKVMVNGGVTLYNCSIKITYKNSVKDSQYYYRGGKYGTPGGTLSGTYLLDTERTVPSSAVNEDSAVDMGNMKLASEQTITGSWMDVELSYSKVQGGALTTLKAAMPSCSFVKGTQYTYYFMVNEVTENLSITGVTLAPWTTETRMADPL